MDHSHVAGHNVSAFLKEVLPRSFESVVPANSAVERNLAVVPTIPQRERIFIELMTSDRKLKASREGSK